MTVGSLVECIDDNFRQSNKRIKYPIKGGIYTVSGLIEKPLGLGLYFLELSNQSINVLYRNGNTKIEQTPFSYKHFREVLPPINIIEKIENDNYIITTT